MSRTRRNLLVVVAAGGVVPLAGCIGSRSGDLSENQEEALIIYGEGEFEYESGIDELSTGFEAAAEETLEDAYDAFDRAVSHFEGARTAFGEVNEVLAEEDTPLDVVDEARKLADDLHALAYDSRAEVDGVRDESAQDRSDLDLTQFQNEFHEESKWEILTPEEFEEELEET